MADNQENLAPQELEGENVITSEMLDWKCSSDVLCNMESWVNHPTLVADPKKKDPDTKHSIGAVKQILKFGFAGVTLRTLLDKAGATYRIVYQNGYARVGSDKDYKNVNKYLLNKDGTERKTISIVIHDFFTGKEKMTDSERANKGIDKVTSLSELEAIGKRVQEKIAKAKQTAKDAITHR